MVHEHHRKQGQSTAVPMNWQVVVEVQVSPPPVVHQVQPALEALTQLSQVDSVEQSTALEHEVI